MDNKKSPTLNSVLLDLLEFENMPTQVDIELCDRIREEHEVYLSKQDLDMAIIGRIYNQ